MVNYKRCNYTILNNYEIVIFLFDNFNFPTMAQPILIIQIQNLIGPAVVGSLSIKMGTYKDNDYNRMKQ